MRIALYRLVAPDFPGDDKAGVIGWAELPSRIVDPTDPAWRDFGPVSQRRVLDFEDRVRSWHDPRPEWDRLRRWAMGPTAQTKHPAIVLPTLAHAYLPATGLAGLLAWLHDCHSHGIRVVALQDRIDADPFARHPLFLTAEALWPLVESASTAS